MNIVAEKYKGNCQDCELNGKPCQDLSTCWNNKYVQNCDTASALKCTEKYCICNNGATQVTIDTYNKTNIHKHYFLAGHRSHSMPR